MKKFVVLLLALVFVLCGIIFIASCIKDDDFGNDPEIYEKIEIDYSKMTYVGTSFKNFSSFFDEQDAADPENGSKPDMKNSIGTLDSNGDGDIDDDDRAHFFDFTIDLKATHKVSRIYLYYPTSGGHLIAETGTPFNYENQFEISDASEKWNVLEIGTETRYINIKYKNGTAPSEIFVYGVQTGPSEVVNTTPVPKKTMGYLLGMNGNKNDSASPSKVDCAPYFRDYINWAWFYETSLYESKGTSFNMSFSQAYDGLYRTLALYKNMDPVPCFMFGEEVVLEGKSKSDPEAYVMYGELLYQVALRYGNNPLNTKDMVVASGVEKINLDYINWIEAGNEPNGEGNDGFTPYQIAALTSVSYDGHCNTVKAPSGSGVGVKNADPNIKLAMAGLAGVGTRYIQAMTFWLEHNRADGLVSLDAFNVHTYCRKTEQYNGYTISYGVAPEIGGITDYVKELTEWRDKYYPDKEVWLTEFGWDTNESWETENACHAYGEFTARDLQAMWLVRAYFMFASVGVDRCAMYMCSDLGDDATSVGKYGTSGVIASNGAKKQSYYYIATLQNTMSDMYFAEIIDSGNENVWIYRFENGQGKSCYAVWCPTMDSVTVDDFVLSIDGESATLTEFAHFEKSGISSELTVTDGAVTVDVSERPVLVFSE